MLHTLTNTELVPRALRKHHCGLRTLVDCYLGGCQVRHQIRTYLRKVRVLGALCQRVKHVEQPLIPTPTRKVEDLLQGSDSVRCLWP